MLWFRSLSPSVPLFGWAEGINFSLTFVYFKKSYVDILDTSNHVEARQGGQMHIYTFWCHVWGKLYTAKWTPGKIIMKNKYPEQQGVGLWLSLEMDGHNSREQSCDRALWLQNVVSGTYSYVEMSADLIQPFLYPFLFPGCAFNRVLPGWACLMPY